MKMNTSFLYFAGLLASYPFAFAFAVADPVSDDLLWGPAKLPVAADLAFAPGLVNGTVHRAVAGEYQFLHGAAIVAWRGQLFASWAASPVDENSGKETLRYSRSLNGGEDWEPARFIGSVLPSGEAFSHGSFLATQDNLFAFACGFRGVASERGKGPTFPGLKMELFRYHEVHGRWESSSILADGFWPMDEPKRLPTGAWIMGGLGENEEALVAISDGPDVSKPWRIIRLAQPSGRELRFAETSVTLLDDRLLAVTRNTGEPRALVAESADYGETWSPLVSSIFPMGTSKPYAGRLSTGQLYVVSNLFAGRNLLTVAVSRPGAKRIERVFKLREGVSPQPLFPGYGKSPQWSYPYAHEHNGNLYVVYSIGKEDCGLTTIPIQSLAIEGSPSGS